MVEKEANCFIQVLRTDRGGEYNSHEFANFCEEHGIKQQLATAYIPQQMVYAKGRIVQYSTW